MTKIIFLNAKEAISLIASGSTIAVGGFVGSAQPGLLTSSLENRRTKRSYPDI